MSGFGVTVTIPCYNQAEFLPEAVESVLAQTRLPLEVIIVDDGSTDPRVEEIGRRYERETRGVFSIRYIRVTNRCLASARNVGIMLARGDWFLPLDADDWLSPRCIERMLSATEGADVVCVGLQEHGVRTGTYLPGYDRPIDQLTLDLMWQTNRLFYCSLIRTVLLREVGGYNGRMVWGYEDWDLWLDLMSRGARFTAVNETLFHYRTKPDSMLLQAERRRGEIIAEMLRHHGRQ